ncbi:aromatase/cyclase [Streptomyces gobiensis]|uniref:aromatase/cyclase n=1 Tax=Streptomyces gobiensis TaxID=2875706 RepID=UPI001E59BA33|nr:aromatase/cyclase [Streptomyces gobiensis]UGY92998.1 aromatase/cyclase [Streptomyces gobiensis]
MTPPTQHRLVHTETTSAPADVVYDLVADVCRWPAVFGPSVYVRHTERAEHAERFQIWALAGDGVKTWSSARTLDRTSGTVTFRQERSHAPVASMGGRWTVRALPEGGAEITLTHEFAAVDNDPAAVRWITDAVNTNTPQELASLRRVAELGHPLDDVVFTFEDRVEVPGRARDAYDFINRADLWPERLPHVAAVTLTEDTPGIQRLEMDTATADGSTHTTRSVRICAPGDWIAYKQELPPAVLLGHSGLWSFADGPSGRAVVTSAHTVTLNPAALRELLGPDSGIADAKEHIRRVLGGNSRRTLEKAAQYAREATATG